MAQIKSTKKINVLKKIEESLLSGEIKSYREYSKELKIHRDTAKAYVEQIIANTPRKSLKEIEFRIEAMYDKVIREAQNMLNNAETNEEKERYIKLLIHCHERFTDFLERFFIKQKASERVDLNADIKSVNVNFLQDIQSLK